MSQTTRSHVTHHPVTCHTSSGHMSQTIRSPSHPIAPNIHPYILSFQSACKLIHSFFSFLQHSIWEKFTTIFILRNRCWTELWPIIHSNANRGTMCQALRPNPSFTNQSGHMSRDIAISHATLRSVTRHCDQSRDTEVSHTTCCVQSRDYVNHRTQTGNYITRNHPHSVPCNSFLAFFRSYNISNERNSTRELRSVLWKP